MDVKKSKKNAIIAASVAGLLAVTGLTLSGKAFAAEDNVNCGSVNACSGKGQCGSKTGGNSCAGKNACKGKGVVMVSKAACEALGGKTEA